MLPKRRAGRPPTRGRLLGDSATSFVAQRLSSTSPIRSSSASQVPTPAPVRSFRVLPVHDHGRPGIDDATLVNAYGYVSGAAYTADCTGRYCWLGPDPDDLALAVEYDMDEQDLLWLEAWNHARVQAGQDLVSMEVFELVMDRLEKEYFALHRRLPLPLDHYANRAIEDSACAVCDEAEAENSNAIVFCDGCNLSVHQDCYGIPYIPEGQWLCRKCTISPEHPVTCDLCPAEGGASKQTTTSTWAHVLCALWVPETYLANTTYMEPVDGVQNIPKSRWKLSCTFCKACVGACIQCSYKTCFTAFHVTCAREHGLLGSMKAAPGEVAPPMLAAYCHKHLPLKMLHEHELRNATVRTATKAASAHSRTYVPPMPLVPAIVFEAVLQGVAKVRLRNKAAAVRIISRYWTLKREKRRGAAMIKRLRGEASHSAAVTTVRQVTEDERQVRRQLLLQMRTQLERIRLLSDSVRKREQYRRAQVLVIVNALRDVLLPLQDAIRAVFDQLVQMDRHGFFTRPVAPDQAPNYATYVSEPMDFGTIRARLDAQAYDDLHAFARDVMLVFDNSMRYNPCDTPYYRMAHKMKKVAKPLLQALLARRIEHTEVGLSDQESSTQALQALTLPYLHDLFDVRPPRQPTPPLTPPPPPPAKLILRRTKRTPDTQKYEGIEDDRVGGNSRSRKRRRSPGSDIPQRGGLAGLNMHAILPNNSCRRSVPMLSSRQKRGVVIHVATAPVTQASRHSRRLRSPTGNEDATNAKAVKAALKAGEADHKEDPFPLGTLVWSRVPGFPHFPAEVISQARKHPSVPARVLAERPNKPGQYIWLVQYLDKVPQYAWSLERDLLAIGADQQTDERLAKAAKHSHWRKRVQVAYNLALERLL